MTVSAGSIPCPPFITDQVIHRRAIAEWMFRVSPFIASTSAAMAATFITAASLSATDGAAVIGFNSTGTSLSATTVQSAINSLVGLIGSVSAGEVIFNPASSLTALDVQAAIVEVKVLHDTLSASFASLSSAAVLKVNLSAYSGATLVGFQISGTSSLVRTLDSRLREVVYASDFGVKGDWNISASAGTDDTMAMQAAVSAITSATSGQYELVLPAGVCQLTAAISIGGAISIRGQGMSPYDGTIGTVGKGSWLFFNHLGKGLHISAASLISGIRLSDFGTYRNQPAPGAGWAPTAFDYDIYINNADVYIPDLMLLNPKNGIFLTNGNAGRLEIGRLRGQAFTTMVHIDVSYDVVKIGSLHQWPFWKDDANVHAYTQANLDVLWLERVDNPMVTNIFSIFARAGIRCTQNGTGKASKIHVANGDFDRGAFGIWVDSSVASGVTGQFCNITHQGETGYAGSKALWVCGSATEIDLVNFRSDYCDQNGVRVEGGSNTISLTQLTLKNYDQGSGGFPAVEVTSGNTVRINGLPFISASSGAAGKYGGAGLIYVDDWRNFSTSISTGSGAFVSASASCIYKMWNNTVDFHLDIEIANNGTGAADVRATLPVDVSNRGITPVVHGRETVAVGWQLQGVVSSSASTSRVIILKYDNAYPGTTGATLAVHGSYPIA